VELLSSVWGIGVAVVGLCAVVDRFPMVSCINGWQRSAPSTAGNGQHHQRLASAVRDHMQPDAGGDKVEEKREGIWSVVMGWG
jgi:hypothetical protein